VQVGGAQLGEVVEVVGQPVEGAAEAVDVADVALRARPLEPRRVDLAAAVDAAQLRGPVGRGGQDDLQGPLEQRVRGLPVQLGERLVDVEDRQVGPREERVALGVPQGGDRLLREPRPQRRPGPCRRRPASAAVTVIGSVSGAVFAHGMTPATAVSGGVHWSV
jgi:hypothetical protein